MTEHNTEASHPNDITATAASDTVFKRIQQIRDRLNESIIGQQDVIDLVLAALLADGHVLLEGVPGLGKTLLVNSLAHCFSGDFKRIQFTPDLMPSDVTGHAMFDVNSGKFVQRKGPVFTNLLLADEINRAPAKTQAALLETMQERQVTIEGKARPLPKPFMVLATQNPIEQEGTYPLPEAQLDRFLIKAVIDYPEHADEVQFTSMVTGGSSMQASSEPLMSLDDMSALQTATAAVPVDKAIVDYAVRLVRATREHGMLIRGAGPRASIALIMMAKAHALLNGRDFVLPDDVKAISTPVLRHRITLRVDAEIAGHHIDSVVSSIIADVDAPRQ